MRDRGRTRGGDGGSALRGPFNRVYFNTSGSWRAKRVHVRSFFSSLPAIAFIASTRILCMNMRLHIIYIHTYYVCIYKRCKIISRLTGYRYTPYICFPREEFKKNDQMTNSVQNKKRSNGRLTDSLLGRDKQIASVFLTDTDENFSLPILRFLF